MPMAIYDECIEWDRATNGKKGYGLARDNGGRGPMRLVHRLVWIEENGPIPAGMLVLHRCDNPPCINIDHLFLGTYADNMRDMREKSRGRNGIRNAELTHCKRGHKFTHENTTVWHGHRACRTCKREVNARYDSERKAQVND